MVRLRKIEIDNFRGIKYLVWQPSNGINCLIGPGDSGKSTLLDAIELCIGAKRNVTFCDTDFYQLNVENSINITVTLGNLSDNLKNIGTYGAYLRGFCNKTGHIEDEPGHELETVLSLNLCVSSDLEPTWSLLSERASQEWPRNLNWADRVSLSPTRIGNVSDFNLSWRRGSILNKISSETVDVSAALTTAARNARDYFGDSAQEQLATSLSVVKSTTDELGIPNGGNIRALLDVQSNGTICLHDANGVPLKNLGIGSTRLLIAGLQRKVAESSSIILIDELEYGLEPHRIIRLLGSLGAKESNETLQVFMTTHSPTALKELSANQLYILKSDRETHECINLGVHDGVQGTLRCHPEAFLSSAILVCEGASEVGFIRGMDQYRIANSSASSIHALGICLVDAGGVDKIYSRATPLVSVGCTTAVLRDDDQKPNFATEEKFISDGGVLFFWQNGHSIEEAICHSVCTSTLIELIDYAVEIHSKGLINDHLKTVSKEQFSLDNIKSSLIFGDEQQRILIRGFIAKASTTKNNSWFKNVTTMEDLARKVIAPKLNKSMPDFRQKITDIFKWAEKNAC